MTHANTNHLGLEKAIAKAGIPADSNASRWLQRALHPPLDFTGTAIPDDTYRPGVRLDLRPTATISAPAGIAPGETWDCCIVTLPGDAIGAVYNASPSGTNFTKLPDPGSEIGAIPIQASATDHVCAVKQYQTELPGTAPIDLLVARSSVTSEPFSFRTTYRSITTHLAASSTTNQGSVTATQLDNDWNVGVGFSLVTRDSGTHPYACVPAQTTIPLTEDEITTANPSSEVWEARKGTYLPLRLIGPVQRFVARSSSASRALVSPIITSKFFDADEAFGQFATLPHTPRVISSASVPGANFPTDNNWIRNAYAGDSLPCDTGFDQCASSVQIYRGLSSEATLQVRMYVGLEMTVMPESPLRTFVASPAPVDERAMELYFAMVSNMRAVYPADFNGLAQLVPILMRVAAYVGPKIAPYVERGAVELGKVVAKEVSHLLGHKTSKPQPKRPPPSEVAIVQKQRKAGR